MASSVLDSDAVYTQAHTYVTLDGSDDNRVLELVRADGESMYVRSDGTWTEINPEDDNARVWDREIIDISDSGVSVYDMARAQGDVKLDVLLPYAMPSDAHLYLTLSDENEDSVLELVRNDETGIYTRTKSTWSPVAVTANNDRVWDRVIVDVTQAAIDIYDQAHLNSEPMTIDMFETALAPEEEVE